MATVGDIINGSLRLIGVLAEGETASNPTLNDALTAFQQMVESWNTERLAVYCTQDQTFTWPANERVRTIGPTGDFVGTRPVSIDPATYFVYSPGGGGSSVSYGLTFINQQQYDGIAVKTVTSTYPQVCWVNNTFPDMTLTVYPVPTSATVWHIISVQELTDPATLATTLSFPPGYLRAFRYNLACELAPEFGVDPPETVQRIAMVSKRDLKRINNPKDVMAMPYPIVASRQKFNIYSSNF